MLSELNFKIGNVSTVIQWNRRQRELRIPQSYRPFIGNNGRPDIRLLLHPGHPEADLGEKIFDGAPIWSLHHYDGGAAVKLFDRLGPRNVKLTLEGQKLFELVSPLLNSIDDLEYQFKEACGIIKASLKIATHTSVMVYLLPEIVKQFKM